jgi:hypothetical protein
LLRHSISPAVPLSLRTLPHSPLFFAPSSPLAPILCLLILSASRHSPPPPSLPPLLLPSSLSLCLLSLSLLPSHSPLPLSHLPLSLAPSLSPHPLPTDLSNFASSSCSLLPPWTLPCHPPSLPLSLLPPHSHLLSPPRWGFPPPILLAALLLYRSS